MSEETLKALKETVAFAHAQLNKTKRISNDKFHMLVTLSSVEDLIYKTENL